MMHDRAHLKTIKVPREIENVITRIDSDQNDFNGITFLLFAIILRLVEFVGRVDRVNGNRLCAKSQRWQASRESLRG